jgi:hypothetical protein
LLASKHLHVKRHEQQNRREGDQEVRKEPTRLHEGCRTYGRTPIGQLGQEVVSRKGRPLGRKLLIGSVLLFGDGSGLLQFALDGVATSEEGADVLVCDLILDSVYGPIRALPVVERERDPRLSP